ncbi:MAG TPA: 2Fe-2S iron-sulfur cluster-binding protein [Pyrinomonadaceae bacterium]|jgi:xanthine dehydrogenase YagT iron-sulfur-binding subunit
MDEKLLGEDLEMKDNGSLEISADEEKLLDELGLFGESRRQFLGRGIAGGLGVFALQLLLREKALAALDASPDAVFAQNAGLENAVKVSLKVNGISETLEVDSRMSLLDTLRERLDLTGTKKGCDQGQCGACTVIVNGQRVLSCLTLAAQCRGKEVTTIEGIANGDELHLMQAAFIKHDGFQCGYCTPGQICSAVALLQEAKNGDASHVTKNLRSSARNIKLTDDEIRERMSGNICRCGAYPGIVAAIREVQSGRETAQTWHFATEDEIAAVMNDEIKEEGKTDEIV